MPTFIRALEKDLVVDAVAAAEPPIVDTHAHIFAPDMPVIPGAWTRMDYAFTAEDYLSVLDQYGIHFGVLSALSIAGYYNDFSLEAVRRHKRLRTTIIAPPQIDRTALESMRDDGVVGIRMQLTRRTELPDFTTEEQQLLLRRVRDLDWHVQVAIEGPLLPDLLKVLGEAGVKVVIDHFGHPDPGKGVDCEGFQALLRAVDKGRTWVKLSGGFRLAGTEAWRLQPDSDTDALSGLLARALLEKAGPERLLWGSDCPFVGYEKRLTYASTLADFYRWVPDAAVRRKISDTALKLYFS